MNIEAINAHLVGIEAVLPSDNYSEFSTSQCDSCGTHLAGYRNHGVGILSGSREIIELDLCADYTHYHANGEFPEE